MQEDVEHRTVSLAVNTAKMTGRVLKEAIQHFLGHSQASTTMNIYLHQLNGGNVVAANAIGALMGC